MALWTETDAPETAHRAPVVPLHRPRPAAAKAATAARPVVRPALRLEDYFAGTTRAWGVFQDRFGTLRRQFEVDIDGRWDGQTLTLTEDFRYDDGETETRVWTLRPDGETGYVGTTADAVGPARGTVDGNAFRWRYRFRLAIGAKRLTVAFDDRMFLQADGTLINRARVTKFGLLLGEATIVFAKP